MKEHLSMRRGEWSAVFGAATATLECLHAPSGARVEGVLAFAVETRDGDEAWAVALPRDGVAERLALLDGQGNVQGYVAFAGDGGRLCIHVVHRAAQSYRGTLTFRGTARLGSETFACRTQAPEHSRVVQMASGPADSALNDSLFDVPTDTALHLAGRTVAIATRPADGDEPPTFDVEMTACPHEPANAALVIELLADYYRSRWVPHYRPVDKQRCPSPPTGWMSWNVYFDQAGEAENLAEARIGAAHLKPFGLEIWSIESWQDNSDALPVSTFHNLTLRPHPGQFPHGMKWLADRIRELGFRPGIWTVPFGTGDAAFYEQHRGWFLHGADGEPMRNWCGRAVLDPSQPAVRQHMEDTHRTMSAEWGYEFFKIDGMSGRQHGYSAHFYERDEVRAAMAEPCDDPLALCIEALRRGIGPDRMWLGCQGHYTGPEAAFVDGARIGGDIVSPNQPPPVAQLPRPGRHHPPLPLRAPHHLVQRPRHPARRRGRAARRRPPGRHRRRAAWPDDVRRRQARRAAARADAAPPAVPPRVRRAATRPLPHLRARTGLGTEGPPTVRVVGRRLALQLERRARRGRRRLRRAGPRPRR